MIDFDNSAIDIVRKWSCQDGVKTTRGRAIEAGTLAVRSRPAFARGQKIGDDRVNAARRGVIDNVCRGRDAGRRGLRAHFAEPLVIDEEEGLVLDDGAAKRPAKLIVVKWILRQRRVVKKI